MQKRKNKTLKCIAFILLFLVLVCVFFYISQRYFAHRNGYFVPDYERVNITEQTDYETIFLQTGLGKSAVDKLVSEGNFDAVLKAQDLFFNPPKATCSELLGYFTREDRLTEKAVPLVDLQPGDILVSLSTHSFGWRHGHAAIVIDKNRVLEAAVLGENSSVNRVDRWENYSNYAVLRVKGVTKENRQAVAKYAKDVLNDVPYSFTAGIIGPKAPDSNKWYFSVQCSYLAWYAWEHFGYDLDSDGGRIVTTSDLLYSDLVEVVQVYGMSPEKFLK